MVHRINNNPRAVIDVTARGLLLMEVAEGYTCEDIQSATEPELHIPERIVMNAF